MPRDPLAERMNELRRQLEEALLQPEVDAVVRPLIESVPTIGEIRRQRQEKYREAGVQFVRLSSLLARIEM